MTNTPSPSRVVGRIARDAIDAACRARDDTYDATAGDAAADAAYRRATDLIRLSPLYAIAVAYVAEIDSRWQS